MCNTVKQCLLYRAVSVKMYIEVTIKMAHVFSYTAFSAIYEIVYPELRHT